MENINILETVKADDFVEYYLFTNLKYENPLDEEQKLAAMLKLINNSIKKHSSYYLWHKDKFVLNVRTSIAINLSTANTEGLTDKTPPHLYGISYFGDNIEDEWFIVYLLTILSKEIDDLIVRVCDSDGEFLLIEAADFLPDWATPENCEKRVFIHNGLIHIVAPKINEQNEEIDIINMEEALTAIRTNPSLTVASPEIQKALHRKIGDYPDKITKILHHAKAYLPIGVAAILKHSPHLIAPAILAFCNRDPIDLKTCKAMKYFPPEQRVFARIKFTKCLYAMLTHSKYLPDRNTGWNLPPTTSNHFKAYNLGVRIACGFEILLSDLKDGDKGWYKYLQTLKNKNYFRDLLEHSKEYDMLMAQAKKYYKENVELENKSTFAEEVFELYKSLDNTYDDLKKDEQHIPEDDNEDWLNVAPEELDQMLQERYGKKFGDTTNPNQFSSKINNFLQHISGLEGAEFPSGDVEIPTRPPRTKNKAKKNGDASEDNNKIHFDPNSFSCAVQNILNFVIPEDDSWDVESDSDMDDYEREDDEKLDYGELKTKMQEYMSQMDAELAKTTIGESFEKQKTRDEAFEDVESFKPVDIDMNALKNMLESYKSQLGEAGPSSNMLGPMGVHLEELSLNPIDSD